LASAVANSDGEASSEHGRVFDGHSPANDAGPP